MKRIPTQKNGFWKRVLINIPFILLVALMIACFGGGLFLMFYSIVSVIAFHSAMIYLIVAGAGAILIGIGLCLITAFQKYFAFYNKKMGWKYVVDSKKAEKTVTYANIPVAEKIKKVFTVSNIGIAILAIGSLFAIISAALGSIDRANWVSAIGGFKEERGYYTDVRKPEFTPTILTSQKNVNISVVQPETNTRKKIIIVVYTKNTYEQNEISIDGYIRFKDDLNVSKTIDGTTENVVVSIGETPEITDSLGKLLFFMFNDYNAERQVIISIPYNMRNSERITIDSEPDRVLVRENDGSVHDYVEENVEE